MPTIEANGLTIGYDVTGAGPPLVLLHGATSDAARDFRGILRPSARPFVATRRTREVMAELAGTRPPAGSRRTGWPTTYWPSPMSWVGTIHLLGFSLGAMTALRVAVRVPERLRTLVVVGVTVEREPRASVARRLMDPVRIDRAHPGWAADLSRRHDPGQGEERGGRCCRPSLGTSRRSRCSRHARSGPSIHRRWWRSAIAIHSCRSTMPGACPARSWTGASSSCRTRATRPWPRDLGIATEALREFYRSTEAVARRRAGTTNQEVTA